MDASKGGFTGGCVGQATAHDAEVAAKAGVSRELVSIMFRGRPAAAGRETRERVLRVADEIGCRPDSAARLLARGRSRTPRCDVHRAPDLPLGPRRRHLSRGRTPRLRRPALCGHTQQEGGQVGRGPGSAERRRACRAAMRRHGPESEARVIPGEHSEQSGTETGESLLTGRDRGLPLPTAVPAGNDRCAWGV